MKNLVKKPVLNLEKYRRQQDRVASRLLEMAARNPFHPVQRKPISRLDGKARGHRDRQSFHEF